MHSRHLLSGIAALAVLAFPDASRAGQNDTLTLTDAIALVLERNPGVEEAARAVDASRARVNVAGAPSRPTVDLEASYTYLAPVAAIEFGGIDLRLFPASNYDGHLRISQTLIDFSKTASQTDLATSRVTQAEDSREIVRRDLAFRTAETFYDILLLRSSVEVQDEQVRTLNEHLGTTQKRIASGTATQLDALTTQVRVAAAQTTRINLQNALHRAEIALRKLAALPQTTALNLRGALASPALPLGRDSLIAVALSRRLESRAAADAIASAKLQQHAAHLNNAPSVSAFALYGFKNGYMPNLDVLRGNLVAGATLKLPILDGSKSSGMEEEADAILQESEARKHAVDLAIESEVEQAIEEANAALSKVEISEVNIERADRAVETARLRYEAGAVQNLDLLDATTDRALAKLMNLQALHDAALSGIQLRRAVGDPAVGP